MVATRSHLVINGVTPVDQLKDFVGPVKLIIEKTATINLDLYKHYGVKPLANVRGDPTRRFLSSFAAGRGHFLR